MRWLPMMGLLVTIVAASARGGAQLPTPEAAPADPTVTLLPSRCAGVVVEERHVATVLHCVRGSRARVRFSDGSELRGRVVFRDRGLDHVLIELEGAAPAPPAPLAEGLPAAGEELIFVGRPERNTPAQSIEVIRIAPCPSLPGAPGAIFSTLEATPGDSGTPLFDGDGAVAGLVHGGARCEIATPASPLRDALPRGR